MCRHAARAQSAATPGAAGRRRAPPRAVRSRTSRRAEAPRTANVEAEAPAVQRHHGVTQAGISLHVLARHALHRHLASSQLAHSSHSASDTGATLAHGRGLRPETVFPLPLPLPLLLLLLLPLLLLLLLLLLVLVLVLQCCYASMSCVVH